MTHMMRRLVLAVMLCMAWAGLGCAMAQEVTYYHTDALGTPVAISNSSGAIVERRTFEPYGRQLTPTTITDGPGYTGHVSDAATGLSYMQQRYYDPVIGRFLSVDPVTAYSNPIGAFNRYWYGNDNPYKFTDPDGRSVLTKLIKLAIKGGDVAATVAGIVDDAKTLGNSEASTGARVLAGVSLLSEIASPVSVGDVKDVAKGVNSVAKRYSRKSYGYNSRNPAAKAAREAGEGKACPKCGETMVSGTRTAPQAQHEPPLSEVHYEHGGADMTPSERREYANSPESLDGANCARCQSSEGARQRQYVEQQEREGSP